MAHEPTAADDEHPLSPVAVEPQLTLDTPMVGLPPLRPQELKIIGRCVSFRCETVTRGAPQVFIFEGMVANISRDTVLMLHVARYTEESFRELQERRRAQRAAGAAAAADGGDPRTPSGRRSPPPAAATTATLHRVNTVGMTPMPAAAAGPDFPQSPAFGSPAAEPAVPANRIPATGDMPAAPYATFQRRRIRNVEFSDDPVDFGFQQLRPTLSEAARLQDLQILRMFVRRFLVHTSQGNNPKNIPLREFIATRCRWPAPDGELLLEVAKEELAALVVVDKEITARTAAAAGAAGGAGRRAGAPRATAEEEAERLRRIAFAHDRANTHISSHTTWLAVLHVAAALALLLYSASAFSTTEKYIVSSFVNPLASYVAVGAALELVTGAATAYSAVKIIIPVPICPFVTRTLFMVAALALMISSVVYVGAEMYTFTEPTGMSLKEHFLDQVKTSSSDVCNYFDKYNCGGYDASCATEPSQCPLSCPAITSVQCDVSLKDLIFKACVPMFAMSIISTIMLLLDLVLLARTIHLFRAHARQ